MRLGKNCIVTLRVQLIVSFMQPKDNNLHLGQSIDNRATKRDWKRPKNLLANMGKTLMTSSQILLSAVLVRRRGPLTGIWSFISCAGHPLKGSCIFTNIQHIYNILVENCTMHSCELYFMQCRNAETIVS